MKLRAGFLAVLFAVYILQIASPLRLNTDAIAFLSMGAAAADAPGLFPCVESSLHPPGFPTLVALLDRAGLGASWAFIALNCACIGLGLAACCAIFTRVFQLTRETALVLCALTLLSFVFIKHAAIPLSDVPFFAAAMLCLATLALPAGSPSFARFAAAAALALAAISIRMAGIALVPALMWWCLPRPMNRKAVIAFSVLALVALAAGVLMIGRTNYFRYAGGNLADIGPAKALAHRLNEWGELAANIPGSKLPAPLRAALPPTGLLALACVVRGIWLRRRSFGVVEVFTLSYAGMVFLWPYRDTRFWLPLLPLLIGWAALGLRGAPRPLLAAWVAWFILTGATALAYSTRLSFAGSRFAELYGDGTLRPAYRAAFTGETAGAAIDPEALRLLRRYEAGAIDSASSEPIVAP